MVDKAKRDGASLDDFRAAALQHLASAEAEGQRASSSAIGMTPREVKAFSVVNLVRYMANPTSANAKRAGFELEAARAAADAKRSHTGLTLPSDVLLDPAFAARAQNTGSAAAGGALVATDHLAGSFVDVLRDRLALAGAGVTMLTGLTGDVDIPKQTSDVSASWIGEGDDGTASDVGTGTIALTPHTVALATAITRRMVQQATPGIEGIVRNSIVNSAARAIQAAALSSAGANAPVPLVPRIPAGNRFTWAAAGAPTFNEMVELETLVSAANADEGAMRYIYNAVTSGALKTTRVDAGSGVMVETLGEVNGYARTKTNQLGDYEVFFGDWSQMVLAMWSGLDLSVDTATLAASGGVVLRAFQDVDVGVMHAEAFARASNV
jgi:HK97 family phage major capsid protein